MITSKHRFHGYNSLRHVYQNGRTVRSDQLAIRIALNDRRTIYRCAVVVAKKVSKSAVVRNRIRRRLYEVIRHYSDDIKEPYDIVITVFQPTLATMEPEALRSAVEALLIKAEIISSHQPAGPTKNTRDIIDAKEH